MECAVTMAKKKHNDLLPWLSAKTKGDEKRFIQIGNSLLLSREFQELGAGAKELYICMAMESGGKREFTFTHGAAKKYGITKTSFDRYKEKLIASKYIEPIYDAECKQYSPCRFKFLFDWKS